MKKYNYESLEKFITGTIEKSKEDKFYNESFCNLVLDYYSSKGGFTKEDIQYLNKNGYSENDFIE